MILTASSKKSMPSNYIQREDSKFEANCPPESFVLKYYLVLSRNCF